MGAYDNPNINVGVDKESGQLIGQAIAGVGQSIAKGFQDRSKLLLDIEKRRIANKKANDAIIIKVNEDILKKGNEVYDSTKKVNFGDSVTDAYQKQIGKTGMTEILNQYRIDPGSLTVAQMKLMRQLDKTSLTVGETASDFAGVVQTTQEVIDGDMNNIDKTQSSSIAIQYVNENYSESTNEFQNNGGQSWDLVNVVSMINPETGKTEEQSFNTSNNEQGNNNSVINVGGHVITLAPPLETEMLNRFTEEGTIIKGKTGLAKFANQELFVKKNVVLRKDDQGTYEEETSFPNTGAIYNFVTENSSATLDAELMLNDGYKSANAYLNTYEGYNTRKVTKEQSDLGVIGFVTIPNPQYADRPSFELLSGGLKDDGTFSDEVDQGILMELPIFSIQPAPADMKDSKITKLNNGMRVQTAQLNNYKMILQYENVKSLGGFEAPTKPKATKKKNYITKNNDVKLTERQRLDASIDSFNKILTADGLGIKKVNGKDVEYNKYQSNQLNVKYGEKPGMAGGAFGFIRNLRGKVDEQGRRLYSEQLLDKFLEIPSDGGKVNGKDDAQRTLFKKSKFYKALYSNIRQKEPELNRKGNDYVTYDQLDQADKDKIDESVDNKIFSGQYKKYFGKGLVYNSAPPRVEGEKVNPFLTTKELVKQLGKNSYTLNK